MRNIILFVLATICTKVTAQYRPVPTQFDTFINRPLVEWAAYASDTVRCSNINLNALLQGRFEKNEIKATYGLYRELNTGGILDYKTPEDIKWEMYPHPELMFDSLGNPIPINRDAIKPTRRFDSTTYNLFFAEQIFFIENVFLKSYIPYASPAASLYTTGDIYLGNIKYFSTCFNFHYNYQPGKQNKILFLSQTKKTIRFDTTEKENKLKELYGRNLIETLWPYILKNKYPIYLADSNKKIHAVELTTDLIEPLVVPIFDSVGNETGKFVKESIPSKMFIAAELLQDCTMTIPGISFLNKIKELKLYANKWDKESGLVNPSPIFKILLD